MDKRLTLVMGVLLLMFVLFSPTKSVRAATITVNSELDTATAGDGLCTLREALTNANGDTDTSAGDCATGSGTDRITFAIGATGSQQTIAPLTNLPTITAPVVLDGWSQGGADYTGPPLIELDGSNLTAASNRGFRITGGGSSVRGFTIHSFDDSGSSAIWLHTANGNWIAGNYIGLNSTGTATLPNTYGIWINNRGNTEPSHDNIIGTNGDGVNDAFEGNVIAGSVQEDVRVETTGNWIAGNRIGTTPDGGTALPSNNTGIRLFGDNNTVGTDGDGVSDDLEGNLISGHDYGVGINNSSGHMIAGNIIGLEVGGSAILGNDFNGIDCNASAVNSRDIVIEGNVISGNGSRGFSTFYNGCRHITITDNKIGTDSSGTVALGNGAEGIIISEGDWYTITHNIISGNGTNGTAAGITTGSGANRLTITDNVIGSDLTGTADLGNTGDGIQIQFSDSSTIRNNQISGNGSDGILISSGDANLIEGNLIGVEADGSTNLGNDDHGVSIFGDAKSNQVTGNMIAYSGRHGVLIDGSTQTISNIISANAIVDNTELGIDLDFDGVTPTDQDDVDTGPNGLQNHPAILSATNTAEYTTIEGVLDSTPSTSFTLEFFSNAACDPSGNGEGAVYLGSDTIATLSGSGGANDTPYSVTLPVAVPQGRYLTATATGPEGTSEFSVCFGPTDPVQDTPIAGLAASNDGPQLDHNPVVLTAMVTGGSNVSYQWDPGDGAGSLAGRIVTHNYTLPGTYIAVVTATNSVSLESATTEVIVERSSSVSGRVWDDVDGDGLVGPGETTFAGETVRVEQNDLVFTGTTVSDGSFVVRGLHAGSYTLFGPTISGYRSFGAKVRILSMPFSGAAIGQWLPYRADFNGVRGRAWQDDNFNGRYDSGEILLAGHLIDLTAVDGGTSFVDIPTDSDGLFRIDAVSGGVGDRHVLSGDTPALYQPIDLTLNYIYQAGYTSNLAFRPGAIGGCVSGAGGATVNGLTLALRDSNGQASATTTTDGDGCYVFSSAEAQNAVNIHLTPSGSDLIVGPNAQPAVYQGAPLRVDWEVTTPGSVLVGISSVDGVSVSSGQSTVSGYEILLETASGVLTATTNFNGVATFESVTPGPITASVPLNGDNIGVYPANWSYDLHAGAAVVAPGFRLGTYGVTAECRTPPVPGQEPRGRAFPCTVDLYRFGDTTPLVSRSLSADEQFFYQPATSGMFRIDLIPEDANALTATVVNAFTPGRSRHYEYPYFLPDQLGPISGAVWTDANMNGTREASEGAAIGFTIELLDSSGAVVESTATDTYGRYHLYPDSFGTFRVRISPPASMLPTTAETRTIVRDPGSATGVVVDFGVAMLADGIEGRVRFSDLWSSNASDVTVQLRNADDGTLLDTATTGPTGHFSFDGLLPDDYVVRVLPPSGGTPIDRLVTASSTGTPRQDINLPADGSKPTILVYVDENANGVADSGEGLSDVSVAFDLGVCGNVVDINTTDEDGFVPSDLVFPNGGCARVIGGLSNGLSPARPEGVELAPYDGGIVPLEIVAEGTVVVRPFWDIDGDRVFDISEPLLLDQVSISAPPSLDLVWTGTELLIRGSAGSYQLNVTPPPTGLVWFPVTAVVPPLSQATLDIPIFFTEQLSGSVIGPNSGAVSGRTVELRDTNDNLIATATTGVAPSAQPGGRSYTPPATTSGGPATASFAFDGVAPGAYTLRIVDPPGGTVASPVDIGFDPTVGGHVRLHLNSVDYVSGVVYWDLDYDGQRDVGEAGTNFYDVVLLNDAGRPEQTLTPAADGTFVFTGLQAGVQYALTVPDLYDATGGSAGNWMTESPGWFEMGDLTVADIGVGNYGSDDPNSLAVGTVHVNEPGTTALYPVPGATVGYYQLQSSAGFCNAANPTILGRTTTDNRGDYRLPLTFIPGGSVQYCLVVLNSPGVVQNDLTVIADAAVRYSLPGGQVIYDQALNLDMDIEMRDAVGGLLALDATRSVFWSAFRDDNLNGSWDADEFPLPGVTLSSGTASSASAVDGAGVISLEEGEHVLVITPPAGYAPVGPETRPVWPATDDVTLPPIGFAPDGKVSGLVFADKDGDGRPGSTGDEYGMGDVPVMLSGPVVRTVATAANGRFSVDGLPDGRYTVSANLPAGYAAQATALIVSDGFGVVRISAQSIQHLTGVLYHDWDGDGQRLADEAPASGVPITVAVPGVGNTLPLGGSILFWEVAPGSYTVDPFWDAATSADVTLSPSSGGGFGLPVVPAGVIRGTVWYDVNKDRVRQPWEAPLSGVAITLDDGASVTTDDKGRYAFVNVAVGAHTLTAALPAGLNASIPLVSITAGRGAALGVPATTGFEIYMPIVQR